MTRNEEVFAYKKRFVTFVLLLGYAFIHTQLTGVYSEIPFSSMVNFSAKFPYGQRLLVPALVNISGHLLSISIDQWFFLYEWIFVSLLYFSLQKLMQQEFPPRQAQLLTWLFILLLPLVTVINYRFNNEGTAGFFYPSDTSSLFFISLGFLLCLRKRWIYFIPCLFLATLNRESSVLLILLIPALHWRKFKGLLKPLLLSILCYLLARYLVFNFLKEVPGPIVEWHFRLLDQTHFAANFIWLFEEQNFLLFLFCFGGLALFWFGFSDYIDERYRPVRYVAFLYFLGLDLVASFMEARVFAEIMVLIYLPTCLALKNWLSDKLPEPSESSLVYYVERYAVLSFIFLIILLRIPLNTFVLWLAKLPIWMR